MGSTFGTIGGGSTELTGFSDVDHATGRSRLVAIVLWRGPEAPPQRWKRLHFVLAVMRALLFELPRHLLGRIFPAVRRAPFPFDDLAWGEWNGASHGGRLGLVRYSTRRGVIEVLGREHPLPGADRTLVVLVDGRAHPEEPAVTLRVVDALTYEAPWSGPPHRSKANADAAVAHHRAELASWQAQLAGDALVRDFLDPR
jgi:hypothetical protein